MLSPDDLRAALAAHPRLDLPALPGARNHLPVGVLVPLQGTVRPVALAILRQPHLTHNPGEVAFPGGRPEPDDADIRATAVREAHEELGLVDIDVLGELSTVPLYRSDYRMTPFVATVGARVVPDAGEVADVLPIDLLELLDRPTIDAVAWRWEGTRWLSPVFPLGPHRLFGASAYVLLELLEVLASVLGRTAPPREVGRFTWEELLGHRPHGAEHP